ncbi:MAG: hypothetical protein SCJ97_06375 [Bacillota bacterium]|nr:hypothetical protein [Bacillota bacterium]
MKLIDLIKVQLRISFGLSTLHWNLKNNKKKFFGSIGLALIVIVSLGPLIVLYYTMLQSAFNVTVRLGQPEVILATGLMISSMLVFFFGLTYVMSVFFFSHDLTLLVPLPLQPGAILGSKFAVIISYEYITIAPFMLPAIWVFGIGTNAGFLYWIISLGIFFLVPIVPLGIASLFVLLLMSLTNLSKRRDTFRIIGMVVLLLLVFALNYFLTGIPDGEEIAYIEDLLQRNEGILSYITRLYPPAILATRALAVGGVISLLNFIYFIGVNLTGLIFVYLVGQKLFYRGLIGGTEISRGKVISEDRFTRKITAVASPSRAIAMREIKYLLRTPVYLFNSLVILIIVPVFLVIPLISEGAITDIIATLRNEIPLFAQIGFISGFIAIMAIFAPASSSSFSREGKLFWISQAIPVSAGKQIWGKLLYCYLITFLTVPLVVIVSLVFLPLSIYQLILAIIAGLIFSFPAIIANLFIDLLRPYLNWDNPQKAIKQNVNVLLGMAAGGIIYAIIFAVGWITYQLSSSEVLLYPATMGSALLLGFLFYKLLVRIAPRRYRDIEV